MASVPSDQLFTSSINLGEMFLGAYLAQPRTERLLDQIQRQILDEMAIIPFDVPAARLYGELRAQLQRQGALIGDPDTQIASIALSRNLIVVTGNMRHFGRIPNLKVENWLE